MPQQITFETFYTCSGAQNHTFLLTQAANNFIYESQLRSLIANTDVREKQTMKNATKKAAKKSASKKAAATKKKK